MALRKIALEGEACLSKMCRPVTDFNSRLHTLLDDLADTLADSGGVGLAAPQVGVLKRLVVIDCDQEDGAREPIVMLNPVIVRQSGAYEAEEGCLSLPGTRKAKRFQTIKVQWQNERLQTRCKTFTGWTAEIIQHEIDHCEGVLI